MDDALADIAPPRWYEQRRAVFLGGNALRLLRYGAEYFSSLETACAQARRDIFVETYIFHDDPRADRVAQALIDAAARGVRVHVMVDGFGSGHALANLQRRFADTGVALLVFRPFRGWRDWFKRSRLRRLHRKLAVIDGTLGFVGGINLIDDTIDLHHGAFEYPRLDFAVEVRGPVVQPMVHEVQQLWLRVALRNDWRHQVRSLAEQDDRLQRLREMWQRLRDVWRQYDQSPIDDDRPMRAAFVVRDNVRQRRTIERTYIQAIVQARHQVDIVTPYFYPGRTFRKALIRAAQRGVRVRLLLQGRIDYKLAGWAARALYDDLLRSGIDVFEYTYSFLHAKVAVIDGSWATVGSSNIDPLSLLLAREANIVAIDEAFAAQLYGEIDQACGRARKVTPRAHRGRGWLDRIAQRWAVLVARLLIALAGRRGKY